MFFRKIDIKTNECICDDHYIEENGVCMLRNDEIVGFSIRFIGEWNYIIILVIILFILVKPG